MFLVSGLSLLLLMYVGFGEAQRTYQQFHIEKLAAQARVVQNAMATFLRPGLPMRQFVGFATLTEPILASDQAIAAMTAFDRRGHPIFVSGVETIALLPANAATSSSEAKSYELRKNDQYFQVILPLQSRFEPVGNLAITMPRSVVTERVQASFQPLLFTAIGLSAAFALFASIAAPRLRNRRAPWLQIVYGLTFLVMAAAVIGTLISLYSDGAQAKTKALANSLGQRLSDIVEFNLNINEIYGLDRTFGDYSRLNPDISAAGLSVNGVT
ncbi:MAG: hypothetical protein OES41_13940, partial [Rhodospirillales bacterium]|nr:hypothetical protein [Rhodospirillales bacterium]